MGVSNSEMRFLFYFYVVTFPSKVTAIGVYRVLRTGKRHIICGFETCWEPIKFYYSFYIWFAFKEDSLCYAIQTLHHLTTSHLVAHKESGYNERAYFSLTLSCRGTLQPTEFEENGHKPQ